MFIARPARPAGCEIVAASRSFTSTAAAVAVNTTSAHGLAVPPEVADGDFLVLGYALGVTTRGHPEPDPPSGFHLTPLVHAGVPRLVPPHPDCVLRRSRDGRHAQRPDEHSFR